MKELFRVVFHLPRVTMTARTLLYASVCLALARTLPFLVFGPFETHNDANDDTQIAMAESRQMSPPMLHEYTEKNNSNTVVPITNYQDYKIIGKGLSLEFVHITKTGGSAVEEAAARESLTWGLCHFERRPSYGPGCRRPTFGWPLTPPKIHSESVPLFAGELWHTPPSWFVDPNPYQGAATFTIVRNPYDRIVSEYYCTFFGAHRIDYIVAPSTASMMATQQAIAARNETTRQTQQWRPMSIQTKKKYQRLTKKRNNRQRRDSAHAKNRKASDQQEPSRGWPTGEDKDLESIHVYAPNDENHGRRLLHLKMKRLSQRVTQYHVNTTEDTPETLNTWVQAQLQYMNLHTGHMLPQYHYCFDKEKQPTITHILRYENLQNEFTLLMKQYKLNVRLPEKMVNIDHANERKGPKMTKNDLWPATIKMINTHMKNDFLWLGYQMIDT